jgi:energy-converting hydrogenase Eha subunit A
VITLRDILLGVILPALTAGGVLFFTARWLGCAAGLALGYMAGHIALAGWPGWPHTTDQWLPYIAGLALAGEALSRRGSRPAAVWSSALLLIVATVVLTARPLIQFDWSPPQSALWVMAVSAALAGLFLSAQTNHQIRPSWVLTAVWTMTAGATALACAMGGSQKLGQFAGVLAAALAVCLAVNFGRPGAALSRGGLLTVVALWAGLLLNGHFYASVPIWAMVLIGMAPLGYSIPVLFRGRAATSRRQSVMILSTAAVFLLAAIVPMAIRFMRAMSADPAFDYEY